MKKRKGKRKKKTSTPLYKDNKFIKTTVMRKSVNMFLLPHSTTSLNIIILVYPEIKYR